MGLLMAKTVGVAELSMSAPVCYCLVQLHRETLRLLGHALKALLFERYRESWCCSTTKGNSFPMQITRFELEERNGKDKRDRARQTFALKPAYTVFCAPRSRMRCFHNSDLRLFWPDTPAPAHLLQSPRAVHWKHDAHSCLASTSVATTTDRAPGYAVTSFLGRMSGYRTSRLQREDTAGMRLRSFATPHSLPTVCSQQLATAWPSLQQQHIQTAKCG